MSGTVQGVGFRPFVYRHAVALGLRGNVRNDTAGVEIDVEGPAWSVEELGRLLIEAPPPLARVRSVDAVEVIPDGAGDGFTILDSEAVGSPIAPVSIDSATCNECLAEVADPADRRYRYPFTNCTNCGPRYTIVRSVPYDRPATTMAPFTMCPACQAEYDDPADRRFHAQPNACPACGPALRYQGVGAAVALGDEALAVALDDLAVGRIVAVKGIGGFHLAVDATNAAAVGELRRRKSRDDKPFAVMVPSLAVALQLCHLDDVAAGELSSPRRPIVLALRRRDLDTTAAPPVAEAVAPGLAELGLMLPYTPLHALLLEGLDRPVVLTSGNIGDEPIAHTDQDAAQRLGPLVDGVLGHDRSIHIRCDDSVVRARDGRSQVLRRSRGYAPEPLLLDRPARRQALAVGAELKSTVSVVKDRWLVASHHLGDLEHPATWASFRQAVEHLTQVFDVEPEVVVHDLHPDYRSSMWAADLDVETWAVQHHHAHVAALMAEHGRHQPVVGLAFDGLGWGPDGSAWGGEVLVAGFDGYRRAGHLLPVPMPGGAAAIREPWRMAVAWAGVAAGEEGAERAGRLVGDDRWAAVRRLIAGPACLPTSGMGRLFDAVAALCGLRQRITYEGQAAIELEAAASTIPAGSVAPLPVDVVDRHEGVVIDPRPLVAEVLEAVERDESVERIAAAVHEGIAAAAVEAARRVAVVSDIDTVALTGGVFQNARFSQLVEAGLSSAGLRALVHRSVPPNDGGISVGQAAIAAYATEAPRQWSL